MIECIIKSPKKRKAPPLKNRDKTGALIMESSNELKDYLEKNIEEYQMEFDDAETGRLKSRALKKINKAIEELETYNTLVNHQRNVTDVIDEMEDDFPKILLCKYYETLQKKMDKMQEQMQEHKLKIKTFYENNK
jgi:hypothetical protein